MYQKVILCGNLGQDPELRHTQNDHQVCNFSVATNERRANGEDHTEWHRCVAWDKLAGIISEHARKGDRVLCEGVIRSRKWEDDSGTMHYATEIHVREFRFAGSKTEKSERSESSSPEAPDDDDIPFDV